MRPIINTTKNVIKKAKVFAYHKEQNKTALRILKTIEKEKGALHPNDKSMCTEYAIDVFGHKKYAPWLYAYCAHAKKFKEGWIPDNYYGEVVVPSFNGPYGKISNRNAVINTLLSDYDSLDICYYVNHLFLNSNCDVLNEEQVKTNLFKNNDKVVFKLEDSRQGKGVYFFSNKTFNLKTINNLGNGVFQNYIEQHSFFNEFANSSVATIRLTSVCDNNGNINVRAGYFRFGRENDTKKILKSFLSSFSNKLITFSAPPLAKEVQRMLMFCLL